MPSLSCAGGTELYFIPHLELGCFHNCHKEQPKQICRYRHNWQLPKGFHGSLGAFPLKPVRMVVLHGRREQPAFRLLEQENGSNRMSDGADSSPATSDLQDTLVMEQGGFAVVKYSRGRDEALNLCKMGQLDQALDLLLAMDRDGTVTSVNMYTYFLKACTKQKALDMVKRVYSHLAQQESKILRYLGEYVVSTLIKCGGLEDALQLFQMLPHRTVLSWTAVISGYASFGQGRESLKLYECMQQEGLQPSTYTFVSLLRACGSIPDLEEGRRIHADALKYRCASHLFVGTCLVDMYAKCGSMMDAQDVFNRLPHHDVVSWNALLMAYAHHGKAEKALQLYEQLLEDSLSPDDRTFVCALQACSLLADVEGACMVDGRVLKVNSLQKGKILHSQSRTKRYESTLFVGNTLVSMYAKCGSIVDSQHVFEILSQRDVVSWNGMLAAYVQQGQAEMALRLHSQMLEESMSSDDRTFVIILQACGMLAEKETCSIVDGQSIKVLSLKMVKAIHADACRKGFLSDGFVVSAVVSSYGKCGSIVDSEIVFGGCPKQGLVSWNAMLVACAQQGQANQVLQLYGQLIGEGVSPDVWTFSKALQACAMLAEKEDVPDGEIVKAISLGKGKVVHAEAWRCGFELDVFVGSSLVSMYGNCGSTKDAQNLFDRLSEPDSVAWNAIISAYAQQGLGQHALQQYREMQEKGLNTNVRTFASILQACSFLADKEDETFVDGKWVKVACLQIGKELHSCAWNRGHRSNVYIGNSLVSLYGKCGSILDAQNVFHGLSEQDVVAWNAMLAVYAKQGQPEEALELYEVMLERGLSADDRTLVIVLQACGLLAEKEEAVYGHSVKPQSLDRGKALQMDALRKGYESDVFVASTLISLYGKCGSLADAEHVFDGLSKQGVVSWTAMLSAYVAQDQSDKALQMYQNMQEEGVNPNEITLSYILQACCTTGSLDICRQIHSNLVVQNGTSFSPLLASTLIHAYGRCASMADAQDVFNALPHPNVVAWNALLGGYAREGNSLACLEWYEKMQPAGVKPNGVTFLSLLSACSHSGLVDKGVEYFESATREFGLHLEIEHYVSMVDLLGRAGCFKRVEDLIIEMPVQPNLSVWLCLLGACRKHGQVVLGRQAFDYAVTLHKKHAAAYILMSSIYAHAGMFDLAQEVNELSQEAGVWRTSGRTWTKHEQELQTFVVGDHKRPQEKQLCNLLRKLSLDLEFCETKI